MPAEAQQQTTAIEDMREDAWFKEALGLKHAPSAVCLRQRLDDPARCDEAGGVAYNLLRLLGQKSLSGGYGPHRSAVKRRRARAVMRELVWGAARFLRRGRRLLLRFGRHCPGFAAFRHVFEWLWSVPASEPQGC